MRLATHFSDPCLKAFISNRLSGSPSKLDEAVGNLLKKDVGDEFATASADIGSFSLEAFKNGDEIENALKDYVLAMVLGPIFRENNHGKFVFDQFTSGLLIENVADAVIRTQMRKECSYRLVDTKGIDFATFQKNGVMLMGIQCKALIDAGKGVLGAKSLLGKLHESSKYFQRMFNDGATGRFAILCGYLYFSRARYSDLNARQEERERIARQFKTEGWPIFSIFKDQETYEIDSSMVDFVRFIESI